MARTVWSGRVGVVVALWNHGVLPGCATAQWARPIGDFQASVDARVAVIGAYYEDLNAYERRMYLENAYLDPNEEVLFTDASGKPTPMAGRVFSARFDRSTPRRAEAGQRLRAAAG